MSTVIVAATPYHGSSIASGSSGYLGSGRGACANMSVVSTVGLLLIFIVGSWNVVLTEAAETPGTILKLWELTGGLQFRSPTISSYSSTVLRGLNYRALLEMNARPFFIIFSDGLY